MAYDVTLYLLTRLHLRPPIACQMPYTVASPWHWRVAREGLALSNQPALRPPCVVQQIIHLLCCDGCATCGLDNKGHSLSTCLCTGREAELASIGVARSLCVLDAALKASAFLYLATTVHYDEVAMKKEESSTSYSWMMSGKQQCVDFGGRMSAPRSPMPSRIDARRWVLCGMQESERCDERRTLLLKTINSGWDPRMRCGWSSTTNSLGVSVCRMAERTAECDAVSVERLGVVLVAVRPAWRTSMK